MVDDENRGIKNLVIDCAEPVLIFEQIIMEVPGHPGDMFKRLLQMNRTLVQGAFAWTKRGGVCCFGTLCNLSIST